MSSRTDFEANFNLVYGLYFISGRFSILLFVSFVMFLFCFCFFFVFQAFLKSLSSLCLLQCQNYKSLMGADRKVTYGNQNTICDNRLKGWYRFEGAAGTRMPPRVHQNIDAIITYPVGLMVRIQHKMKVRSPGRFASTSTHSFATNQFPSK